jgi:hypothetical protein
VVFSISGLLAGCRSKPAPGGKYFVRLDTLLPLHPAWAQVTSLTQMSQALQAAPAQAATLRLPVSPLPASFPAPETVPRNLEQERLQRIASDVQRRIAALTQDLRRRNEERLRAAERAGRKELEARLANAKVTLEAALPARLEQIRREYEARITPLGFKAVAFETQVTGFGGQARQDARVQLKAVRDEISRLNQEQDVRLAEARTQVQNELVADQTRWTKELETRLAQQRQELERLAAEHIAQEQASLNGAAAPIPPLASLTSSVVAPQASPQPPAVPKAGPAFGQAQAQVHAAVQQQKADMEAQRVRLIATIRSDTQQAVAQIARQEGWQLVAEGAAGARDATRAVADALRAQWRLRNNI